MRASRCWLSSQPTCCPRVQLTCGGTWPFEHVARDAVRPRGLAEQCSRGSGARKCGHGRLLCITSRASAVWPRRSLLPNGNSPSHKGCIILVVVNSFPSHGHLEHLESGRSCTATSTAMWQSSRRCDLQERALPALYRRRLASGVGCAYPPLVDCARSALATTVHGLYVCASVLICSSRCHTMSTAALFARRRVRRAERVKPYEYPTALLRMACVLHTSR